MWVAYSLRISQYLATVAAMPLVPIGISCCRSRRRAEVPITLHELGGLLIMWAIVAAASLLFSFARFEGIVRKAARGGFDASGSSDR